MESKNTKLKIKETALTLFSREGFTAVSIRDICKEVGIKESTVYYHFKNKQDIFEELLRDFDQITNGIQQQFNSALSQLTWVEEQPFIMVGLGFLNQYLLEERILKFLRMLMIEQFVNHDAANLYHQILFDAPLKQNTAVFEKLIQMGCFKSGDSERMALEYYAPIFYLFHRYFASDEVTAEKQKEANDRLAVHLGEFYQRYKELH